MSSKATESPRFGLVLSGGGARAAYQVGVMRGIARALPKDAPNPFHIIAGTSAGALNAAALGTHAQRLRTGVRALEYIWGNIDSSQVYRVDTRGLLGTAAQWTFSFLGNRRSSTPVSLLDNSPLEEMLHGVLRMGRLQENMAAGHLDTISITASAYYSGNSVSFFQSRREIDDWHRPHRVGLNTGLSVRHLLASTAIPTLFPAVKIGREYYGDGAIRQLAPLSPAIRLGADRILAIGVSGSNTEWVEDESPLYHPSLGQIIGHVLNSAFVDTLESDMAVLRRYNRLLANCQTNPDPALRPIELLEITPSIDLNAIASRHADDLPRAIRLFIRDTSASSLVSLLLFEQAYCRELMELGLNDALAKREQIQAFFRIHAPVSAPAAPQPA